MSVDELETLAEKIYPDVDKFEFESIEQGTTYVRFVDRSKEREIFKVAFQMGYEKAMQEYKEKPLHVRLNDLEYK